MSRLAGRIAVVTGGASGQGRAASLAAAREGAAVAVLDLNEAGALDTASAIESEGGKAVGLQVDVADEDSVVKAFANVDESLGAADCGLNFAGIVELNEVAETPLDQYERIMGINVRGVWLCSKEVIKRALARKQPATIVNIASVNAFFMEPNISVYCASKGAVYALSRAMAFDHAKDGIRVNCICPGAIDTNMMAPFLADEDARRQTAEAHAVKRLGQPEEIAATAVFLSSDEASFIHGAAIVADGGVSIGIG